MSTRGLNRRCEFFAGSIAPSDSKRLMDSWSAKPQLRVLIDYLARITDTRQSWKVVYPLLTVLFPVVCGTIASGDDDDDIAD
jgi:hypothetical protein